jgi:hypothetical protein
MQVLLVEPPQGEEALHLLEAHDVRELGLVVCDRPGRKCSGLKRVIRSGS